MKKMQQIYSNWWEEKMPKVKLSANLLSKDGQRPNGGDTKRMKKIIKDLLDGLGISYERLGDPYVGPMTTTFPVKLANNTRIQDLRDISEDLALRLVVGAVRIVAPLPATDLVGIELPNQLKAVVDLRGVLSDRSFRPGEGRLLVPLGRDYRNQPIFMDLAEGSGLLIGGATGSGKSVFLNSLIISLMTQYGLDRLRFLLADPIGPDFMALKDLPYLISPAITANEKLASAIKWCAFEMEKRYDLLNKEKASNIHEYNKTHNIPMPFLVFIISEIRSLLKLDGHEEIFNYLIRLLQLSRASGIHIIIASQILDELTFPDMVKANIFSRLAFATATAGDSVHILDQPGAERLLGRGDALYVGLDYDKPVRIQVPYIMEGDVAKFVREAIRQAGVKSGVNLQNEIENMPDPEDPLLEEAFEFIKKSDKASASMLQRHFRIGYARSASIIDCLREQGRIK